MVFKYSRFITSPSFNYNYFNINIEVVLCYFDDKNKTLHIGEFGYINGTVSGDRTHRKENTMEFICSPGMDCLAKNTVNFFEWLMNNNLLLPFYIINIAILILILINIIKN